MDPSIRIRKGFSITIANPPRQVIGDAPVVASVALLAADYPGLTLKPLVETGARVNAGDAVLADRRRPDLIVPSPVAGIVRAITRGAHHRLEALVIEVEQRPTAPSPRRVATTTPLREMLVQSGLWMALRARPFGLVPDPESTPDAIFVTTIDTNPLAVDPRAAIVGMEEEFARGASALATLTEGPLFVCQAPGPPLVGTDVPRVRVVNFEGPHPAGLPGTHIHHLAPPAPGRAVWHIGWQEVAAIGHLLATGEVRNERIVSIAGPGVREPRLVSAVIGASLEDLTRGQLEDGPFRMVSGSPLDGRVAANLGRFDTQVAVLDAARPDDGLPLLTRLLGIRPRAPAPLIPLAQLDRVEVAGIPAVPLLRALSTGDSETAAALGCLALVEEDVALLSYFCASRSDYGVQLRSILDDLAESL